MKLKIALFAATLFAVSPAFAKDGRTDPNPHTGTGSTHSSSSGAKFYPSCSNGHHGEFCGGRAPGSPKPTGTNHRGTFFPSCSNGHHGEFCGGK